MHLDVDYFSYFLNGKIVYIIIYQHQNIVKMSDDKESTKIIVKTAFYLFSELQMFFVLNLISQCPV